VLFVKTDDALISLAGRPRASLPESPCRNSHATEFTPPKARPWPIFDTLIVAGWAGRDHAAIEHHIEELAALGISRPSACRCTTASPATS
jgi:hypothetical protein